MNYKILHEEDTLRSRGGGILIAAKSSVFASHKIVIQDNIEHLFVRVSSKNFKFIISAVYFAQFCVLSSYQKHIERIADIALKYPNSKWIIMGDYNLPKIKWYNYPLRIS